MTKRASNIAAKVGDVFINLFRPSLEEMIHDILFHSDLLFIL